MKLFAALWVVAVSVLFVTWYPTLQAREQPKGKHSHPGGLEITAVRPGATAITLSCGDKTTTIPVQIMSPSGAYNPESKGEVAINHHAVTTDLPYDQCPHCRLEKDIDEHNHAIDVRDLALFSILMMIVCPLVVLIIAKLK